MILNITRDNRGGGPLISFTGPNTNIFMYHTLFNPDRNGRFPGMSGELPDYSSLYYLSRGDCRFQPIGWPWQPTTACACGNAASGRITISRFLHYDRCIGCMNRVLEFRDHINSIYSGRNYVAWIWNGLVFHVGDDNHCIHTISNDRFSLYDAMSRECSEEPDTICVACGDIVAGWGVLCVHCREIINNNNRHLVANSVLLRQLTYEMPRDVSCVILEILIALATAPMIQGRVLSGNVNML